MDSFKGLSLGEVRTALPNATRHRKLSFIPGTAFKLPVRRQIHRFLKPSLTCIDVVYGELTRLAETASSALARFHLRHVSISEATLRSLRERKKGFRDRNGNGSHQHLAPRFFWWQASDWHLVWDIVGAHLSGAVGSDMMQVRETGRGDLTDSWDEENLLDQQPQVMQ